MLSKAALALAVCGLAVAAPRQATACPPAPHPYVTLTDVVLPVGEELPTDLGLVVRGKQWGPSGGPFEFAEVNLYSADGVLGVKAPGKMVVWNNGEPAVAFSAQLPPRTRFLVEVTTRQEVVMPPDAEGPVRNRYFIQTGSHMIGPPRLAGGLRVQLEPFDADTFTCEGKATCGGGRTCAKTGTVRALRARIIVPAMTGGTDFDGYRGWLRFASQNPSYSYEPRPVNEHWLDVRPGEEREILQEIHDEAQPYSPCFILGLWDPTGRGGGETKCLPALKASDYLRELERPAAPAGMEEGSTGGCHMMPGHHRGGACLPVAVAWALFILRRRSRPAARRAAGMLAMLCLGSCGPGSAPVAEEEFCPEYARRVCTTVAGWCGAAPETCQQAVSNACQGRSQIMKNASRQYDAGKAAACLSKVKAVHAQQPITLQRLHELENSCARVFQGHNRLYEHCTHDFACEEPLVCPEGRCAAALVPVPVSGAPCYRDEGCPAGEYCSRLEYGLRRCQKRPDLDEPCEPSTCMEHLRCSGMKCVKRLPLSATCGSHADCALPFAYCEPGTGVCGQGVRFAPGLLTCQTFSPG